VVKSTIATGKALLTSTSSAMRGTCNSLIVLGSFSDGLLKAARSPLAASSTTRSSTEPSPAPWSGAASRPACAYSCRCAPA
jgi:hypothetical protein